MLTCPQLLSLPSNPFDPKVLAFPHTPPPPTPHGIAPQIIKTATVVASACKRANTMQFHDSKIKFPVTRKLARPSAPEFKTLYKANRPSVAMW